MFYELLESETFFAFDVIESIFEDKAFLIADECDGIGGAGFADGRSGRWIRSEEIGGLCRFFDRNDVDFRGYR